jgi:hypothetical protein
LGAQAGSASNGWLQAAGYLLSDRGQTLANAIYGRYQGAAQERTLNSTFSERASGVARDDEGQVIPTEYTGTPSRGGATTPPDTQESVSGNYNYPNSSGNQWGNPMDSAGGGQ